MTTTNFVRIATLSAALLLAVTGCNVTAHREHTESGADATSTTTTTSNTTTTTTTTTSSKSSSKSSTSGKGTTSSSSTSEGSSPGGIEEIIELGGPNHLGLIFTCKSSAVSVSFEGTAKKAGNYTIKIADRDGNNKEVSLKKIPIGEKIVVPPMEFFNREQPSTNSMNLNSWKGETILEVSFKDENKKNGETFSRSTYDFECTRKNEI